MGAIAIYGTACERFRSCIHFSRIPSLFAVEYFGFPIIYIKDERGAPDNRGRQYRTVQPKKKSDHRVVFCFNSGDGPVRDPGNGLGQEQGSFTSVRVFCYGLGLNFDSSGMILYINIHWRAKEIMTN